MSEPWKDMGYESFEEALSAKEQAIEDIRNQLEERNKTIGRQGDEMGTLRKTLDEQKENMQKFQTQIELLKENKPEAEPVTPSAPAVDPTNWEAEERKVIATMTPEQLQNLKDTSENLPEDAKQLLEHPEGRVEFMKEIIARTSQVVQPSNPFSHLINETPNVRNQIKQLFEQGARASKITSPVAPIGNAAPAGSSTTAKVDEQGPNRPSVIPIGGSFIEGLKAAQGK